MNQNPSSEAPLTRRLLALLVALVAAAAGTIALLCVCSLGMAAVRDLLSAWVGGIAPNPDLLSVQWSAVREWLIVCTAVAILAGMGVRDLLRSGPGRL